MFFFVYSSFKSLLTIGPFAKSPALSPTLYKFIVLGLLGSYPKSFELGLQIVTLHLLRYVFDSFVMFCNVEPILIDFFGFTLSLVAYAKCV